MKRMATMMAKLESAAGEGDKAKVAAEKFRAQVAGLQESNDKYREDLGAATEELRRLQSEKDRQMVEQLAQAREEIRRLSRQVEAREATLINEQETTWRRPRQTRSGGMPERHLPGTSDLRGEY